MLEDDLEASFFYKNVITDGIFALESLLNNMDETNLQQAIKSIVNCEGRLLITGVGKSAHIARLIASTFASTGLPSFYISATDAAHGDIGMINKEDLLLVLSNSGNSTELLPILNYATLNKINIIAITSNQESVLANHATIKLITPAISEAYLKMPSNSIMMSLSICYCLVIGVAKSKNFTLENYSLLHPGGAIGLSLTPVAKLMHTNQSMPLVAEHELISQVIVEMSQKRLGCVGVVNAEQKLTGIITDGDLRRHLDPSLFQTNAAGIMTKDPKVISVEVTVEDALAIMERFKITCLFVTNDIGVAQGIIHIHDCLQVVKK
ncbi:MAG: KpsF/GutQ family sugar-phosphate isomerase, partial [Pseudomonadota bacterium]